MKNVSIEFAGLSLDIDEDGESIFGYHKATLADSAKQCLVEIAQQRRTIGGRMKQ
jgi:hypothetical protein